MIGNNEIIKRFAAPLVTMSMQIRCKKRLVVLQMFDSITFISYRNVSGPFSIFFKALCADTNVAAGQVDIAAAFNCY